MAIAVRRAVIGANHDAGAGHVGGPLSATGLLSVLYFHELRAIVAALEEARSITGRPTMLIARTVEGKGVSFMEGDYLWHAKPISDEEKEILGPW